MPTREPPSPHFGDPSGPHWSAFPPPGREDVDDEPLEIDGVLRFRMPEDEVDFPLWDDQGLLPEEPEILHEQLGLSLGLVADLMDWGRAWNAADRGEAGDRDRAELMSQAALLVDRLCSELGDGQRVELDL